MIYRHKSVATGCKPVNKTAIHLQTSPFNFVTQTLTVFFFQLRATTVCLLANQAALSEIVPAFTMHIQKIEIWSDWLSIRSGPFQIAVEDATSL